MAVDLTELCADLAAETTALMAALAPLDEAGWLTPTPAEGWSVKDQIGHLSYFDEAVVTAVTEPDRFRAELVASLDQVGSFVETIARENRARTGAVTLERFNAARETMVDAFVGADPAMRVPWYGPDMSLASALTARIMETWAHGQDVFDGLGLAHPVTTALRQVAHIGVRALPNSFITRGLGVPTAPVRIELRAPDGGEWSWGPADAADRVRGSAVDFCLVVTQRRHRDDTDLVTDGEVASEWMAIAQAFAGPAGGGRRPGQFGR